MTEKITIHSFLENAAKAKVREEFLDGRKYIVVPTVMIVEGVHNGSQGPVYYAGEDLSGWTVSWNHKPAVVYHPKANKGGRATASDPVVMAKSQVGFVLNTGFDEKTGKLRTETWLDVEKTDRVDPRILRSVRAGRPVEVSTGLTATLIENTTEETFNGKKYKYRATKLQADHLAILPDQVGACSIAAGAGLLVENAEGSWDANETAVKTVTAVLDQHYSEMYLANDAPVENGLSMTEISGQLKDYLRAAHGEPGRDWYGYIHDLYPSTFIYSDSSGRTFAQAYSVKGNKVSVSGEPTPVNRIYKYADASGKVIDNAAVPPSPTPVEEDTMTKKEKIDALIANQVFLENERAQLETWPEPLLLKISHEKATPTTPAPTPAPAPAVVAPVVNAQFEDVLKSAPPAMRNMLVKGMETYLANKANQVKVILATPNCAFTEDVLNAMDDKTLDGIFQMIAKPTGQDAVLNGLEELPPHVAAYLGQTGGRSIQNSRPASGPTDAANKPPVLKYRPAPKSA